MSANAEMIQLYWEIGKEIISRQESQGWGAKVVDRLAGDLSKAFPDMKGFSPRNLKFMRAFAVAYPEKQIVKQLVSQIPWGHVIRIMQKVKKPREREFYIRAAVEHGWSRAVLVHQIEAGLHRLRLDQVEIEQTAGPGRVGGKLDRAAGRYDDVLAH